MHVPRPATAPGPATALVAAVVAAAGSCTAPPPEDSTPDRAVEYRIEGDSGEARLVLWQGHGAVTEEADDVRLPFSAGVRLQDGEKAAVTASGDESPRTCRILVDGETVVEQTAPERVTCELVVAPGQPQQAPEQNAPR
ncbi:hypothetical protein IQ251_12195 [Saccharopolyspora sp. HNM0983]|uniref:MmpS family membrane protein n=1 Tax=Saccharopolyspora montiporae TaxID=2781240 RepID=A0A929G0C6_9PSEU|nr:hypothetical protein [Saccharopolyspora sp. HNM0983]MBE9375204.1 hypothetical protein [Saccharopolyspora sp. HNM0983]